MQHWWKINSGIKITSAGKVGIGENSPENTHINLFFGKQNCRTVLSSFNVIVVSRILQETTYLQTGSRRKKVDDAG